MMKRHFIHAVAPYLMPSSMADSEILGCPEVEKV